MGILTLPRFPQGPLRILDFLSLWISSLSAPWTQGFPQAHHREAALPTTWMSFVTCQTGQFLTLKTFWCTFFCLRTGFHYLPWLDWNLVCRPVGLQHTQNSACLCLSRAGIKSKIYFISTFLCSTLYLWASSMLLHEPIVHSFYCWMLFYFRNIPNLCNLLLIFGLF